MRSSRDQIPHLLFDQKMEEEDQVRNNQLPKQHPIPNQEEEEDEEEDSNRDQISK